MKLKDSKILYAIWFESQYDVKLHLKSSFLMFSYQTNDMK